METKPISFGISMANKPRRTANKRPLSYYVPKGYHLDTSVSKGTLIFNKICKFLKSIPTAIAKGFKE